LFKKLVVSAVFAGFAAGLIAAVLQLTFVQPVLLEAELYESGQKVHFTGAVHADTDADADVSHDHSSHSHDAVGPPASTMVRNGLSVLFLVFTYAGYGLIMTAGFAFANSKGFSISVKTGLLWGLAGFIAVQFAPAAGLPPELPGTAAADVMPRQIWWLATAAATASGLWLIAYGAGWAQLALAVVLVLGPHVIGAPHADILVGTAPPELASLFASRALAVGMASWAILGVFTAYLWQK
jgi:cobalt transporter subunit CbtA